MPPRKSGSSIVSNGGGDQSMTDAAPTPSKTTKDGIGIDDLTLPKSMIARLAKGVLPPNTQIQKDALLALHKSATVFVSYIANAANELTQANMKKTIMPQDVFTAIKDVEFDAFLPRLQAELKKHNDMQCDKRNSYRHRIKQEKAAAAATTAPDEPITTNGSLRDSHSTAVTKPEDVVTVVNGDDGDAERPAKKLKGAEGEVLPPPNGVDSRDQTIAGASNELQQRDGIGLDEDIDEDSEHSLDEDEDADEEDDEELEDPEESESLGSEDEDESDHPDTVINPNGVMRDEALDGPDSD